MKKYSNQLLLESLMYSMLASAFAMSLQIAFKQYNITLDTKTLMLYNLN